MVSESNFYKNIIENFPEGIAVCDAENNIIDVNKNFEILTGFSKQDILNKKISEFIARSKSSCKCEEEASIVEGNKPKSYYLGELKDKAGDSTCIRINYSITRDGKTIYLIIPVADVAFLNQAHIDFVSTVSHELRTPLTSIKGFADTLILSGGKLTAEQQNKFLNIIKSQVDRLTRLVEDLLAVSKLESKKDKLIYSAVELPDFFENIIYNVQSKAKNHRIILEIIPNIPPIWADSDKFEQIITNLVDNAIKYSKACTDVIIFAGFSKEKENFIEIKVIDQGVGIPEEYIPKIFNKFSRIDNPLTRQAEGTGLGLYITKSLVENMGGKINVESSSKGSVFSLILPVATVETPAKTKF